MSQAKFPLSSCIKPVQVTLVARIKIVHEGISGFAGNGGEIPSTENVRAGCMEEFLPDLAFMNA